MWLVGRHEVEVRHPSVGFPALGDAGAHEEPVRPGVELLWVAELGKVAPNGEQRLLRRVLGTAGVAQDPVRHPVESVARGDGEAREGLLVAPLRPSDQVGIHASSALRGFWTRALTWYRGLRSVNTAQHSVDRCADSACCVSTLNLSATCTIYTAKCRPGAEPEVA